MHDRSSIPVQAQTRAAAAAEPSLESVQAKPPAHCLFVQRKLTIGAVDDPLEDEADAMADKVMRMPEPSFIQRKCAHCEEEEKLQRKPLPSFLQKKAADGQHAINDNASRQIQSAKGGGSPLPQPIQSFMESRFGASFSGVRIHTDAAAAQTAEAINAQAFTVGKDIFFNGGKYAPESAGGGHLLAHELTHVLQQEGNAKELRPFVQRQAGSGTSAPPAADGGLSPEMLRQIARRLRQAMEGWGTDEEAIYSAFAGRTQEQADAVAITYQSLFGQNLLADLRDELTEGEMRHLGMFSPTAGAADRTPEQQAQSRAEAVAVQLRNAMAGWGTDEASIMSVLTGRTTAELNEIKTAYR